ncbi:hypothetical protein [Bosea sp. 2RAB26]|uniref:hypothetical protein n=1 Tax=Bosea sp. 2RAB26 TaxID=3237476 RepID=UPI003F92D9BB
MPAAEPRTPLTIHLSAAELTALDRYLRKIQSRRSREEAVAEIVARWATGQGLLPDPNDKDGLELDELNASNDA